MKKITLLLIVFATSLSLNAQDVEFDFDDNTTQGWVSSGTNLIVAGSVLNVEIKSPTNGYQGIKSSEGSLLGLDETEYNIVRIVVENNMYDSPGVRWTQFQLISYNSDDLNNVGASAKQDFTIADIGGDQTINIPVPVNNDGGEVLNRVFIRVKAGNNSLEANSNLNFDSITFVDSTPLSATFSSFVQNPDFEDKTGSIAPWTVNSADISIAVSSTANNGVQAAKIDVVNTLGGTVVINNNYTNVFDTSKTVASGDNVTFTFDMKSNNNTTLEIAPRFAMTETVGGATRNHYAGWSSVSSIDTYEQKIIVKSIAGTGGSPELYVGVKYDDIGSLGFSLRNAVAGDNVYIDNITATTTIEGVVLSVEEIQFKQDATIALYPNPVENVLTVLSSIYINKVEVFNLLGQKEIESISSNILDTSNLTSGVYIIKIYQEDNVTSTKKFIKQ